MADSTTFLQPVYVYQGEDSRLNITMDPVIDITGFNFVFTIRTGKGEGTLLLQLTTTGGGVSLSDPTNGVLSVNLTSAQMDALEIGQYFYDVWRTDIGNTYIIVEPSKFKVYAPVYFVSE